MHYIYNTYVRLGKTPLIYNNLGSFSYKIFKKI